MVMLFMRGILSGRGRGRAKTNDSDMVCYFCEKKEHMKKDCPKWQNWNNLAATYQKGQLGNFGETRLIEDDCND